MLQDPARAARLLAFATPAALLGGAYISQYGFGLFPCEMCWWQRYPHFVALVFGMIALLRPPGKAMAGLAGLAILVSGLIGLFHAGVEYKWWEGFTACTSLAGHGGDALSNIMNAPMIRCDEPQWTLAGISLAGFNFLFSTGAALAIFALLARANKGAQP